MQAKMGEPAIEATVSAGIAEAHSKSTLDSLIQAADLALYRAKIQGRDRVEVEAAGDRKQPAGATIVREAPTGRLIQAPIAARISVFASSESHAAGPLLDPPTPQPSASIRG
jgi:predicted signal transduction protein with EAL and GGDEF domain